ncbi:MAG TPA: hypothetical protein VGI64_05020 [Streptosporangiaceae bacterium]
MRAFVQHFTRPRGRAARSTWLAAAAGVTAASLALVAGIMSGPAAARTVSAAGGATLAMGARTQPIGSSGHWTVPFRSHTRGTFLRAIVTPGHKDAWAFGDSGAGVHSRALALHWQGAGWRTARLPHAAALAVLGAGSSSPGNVWVVGSDQVSGQILVQRFDGRHWSVVPTPTDLDASSPVVISRNDVWALGDTSCESSSGGGTHCSTLLWHWTGSSWSHQAFRFAPTALAAVSARNVLMIGRARYNASGDPAGPLVVRRWNGSSWRLVHGVPQPRNLRAGTSDVAIGSARDIWIGRRHWNGQQWRVIPAPPSGMMFGDPEVTDRHGGVWLGPFAHWNGHGWIDTFPSQHSPVGHLLSQHFGIFFGGLARIPGSDTVLAAGGISRGSVSWAVLAAHGRLP